MMVVEISETVQGPSAFCVVSPLGKGFLALSPMRLTSVFLQPLCRCGVEPSCC